MEYRFNEYMNEYECVLREDITLYINKNGRLRYNNLPKDISTDELFDLYYTTINITNEAHDNDIKRLKDQFEIKYENIQIKTIQKIYECIKTGIANSTFLALVVFTVLFVTTEQALSSLFIFIPSIAFLIASKYIIIHFIEKKYFKGVLEYRVDEPVRPSYFDDLERSLLQ